MNLQKQINNRTQIINSQQIVEEEEQHCKWSGGWRVGVGGITQLQE